MPRVLLAAVLLLAGLLPLTAGALGLGEITLRSALNQPFVAEIQVTADADELGQLSVQLAPGATFERFGLDRPRFLEDLRFNIEREGSRALVRVTSTQPVSEPFISLLLDVSWPQGRLLREYTVLLDPPAFAGSDPLPGQGSGSPKAPRPAAPVAAGPSAAAPAIRRAPDRSSAGESPGGSASGRITSGPDGESYGPVRANETLWGISEKLQVNSGASVNQIMLALYRANPKAFAGNINVLRRGAVLRVPQGNELAGIASSAATAEVRRQDEEWRRAAGGAPAPARLQLVPPTAQAAGSAIAPSGVADRMALERELAEQQRLLSLKDSQLKALQDRVKQLEGPAKAPEAAAPVEAQSSEIPAAAPSELPVEPLPAPAVSDEPVAAELPATTESPQVEPRQDKRKPARSPAQERQKDGGFLRSLGELVSSGAFLLSAAAVLLAGLFFVFARRRMASADEATGRFGNDLRGDAPSGAGSTQPVVRRDGYMVEEGAGERGQAPASRPPARDADAETPLERTISTEGAVELDQADLVAEADFHMAYGLYDQAAELLTRALRDSPDRRDLRLKLLEVFFIWENKASFLKEAQTYHRQMKGSPDSGWNKVLIMGKQICPGESLFAGAVTSTGDAGLDLALADDDQGGVDISFDEADETSLDLDLTGARKGPASDLLDFDLGSMDEASADDTGLMQTEVSPRGGSSSGARTSEVPTVEARYAGDYSPTMETPTIESRSFGSRTVETPTLETPTIEMAASGTLETPTLESAIPGRRSGMDESRRAATGDQTEEINLEDLGLDLTGLDEAAGDLGTGLHAAVEGDAGSDVYDLSADDDQESDLLQGLEGDSTAEVRRMVPDEGTLDLPAFGNAMQKSSAGRSSAGDSDTAEPTAEHRAVDDTAEQPRMSATALGEASAELSQVDFDIGDSKGDDIEPTSVMTGRRQGPEGPTMTEVGTKLDLARAYVDMGDPDGARSILNEVLEEGDSAQRQEARRLLDDLTD